MEPLRSRAAGMWALAVILAVVASGCTASSAAPRTRTRDRQEAAAGCLLQRTCYRPGQFAVAYGFQSLLGKGIDGRGQTVLLLEKAVSPVKPGAAKPAGAPWAATDIRADLALFDSEFGLPAARLLVDNVAGWATPWLADAEEVEDTEIVHALAPGAVIREIVVPPDSVVSAEAGGSALGSAVRLAVAQGGVLSISAGYGEDCFTVAEVAQLNAVLLRAEERRLTVVVSSGDSGAAGDACPGAAGSIPVEQPDLPAADPLVLAVGGTSLQASQATGAYVSETGWNLASAPRNTSGGGFSRLFTRPAYQDGVPGIGPGERGVPDVAADADAATGMALAFRGDGASYVIGASGTSAAAPLWAALVALADQDAGHHLGLVNPAIYRIARGPAYHQAFHDVTFGGNGVSVSGKTLGGYRAGPGWDPVTGWGSPDASVLVPLLADPRLASRRAWVVRRGGGRRRRGTGAG
jgi:subtilase family serine protease